ncbi:hypothetical protein E2562_025378 [Oryza meyeriana var. granulata]|uniref:Uncharacterized protein n=1 Tax=Oryza meyeriana var. granulata TaxID=110450 RepID=A0A6G1DN95_9ORYZ|nr:hypothetical protein E2562_025378 [Oryza meyeriana var. granulata]
MKIFSWVANKISGKQEANRFPEDSSAPYRANVSDCRKDEFSDWPQSLLAIGTFGNKQIEEEAQVQNSSDNVQSVQDAIKFTEEEVDNIRKEFEMLLAINDQAEAQGSGDDDQVPSQKRANGEDNEKHRQLINKRIIISKSKNSLGKKGNMLKPTSVASLLKLFMCKGGFTSVVPEPRNSFPQSRMEKLLRAILQKKIHPQNSSTLVAKKHLDWKPDKKEINECLEDALRDLDDDGAKWVKTDSEYIVLEM